MLMAHERNPLWQTGNVATNGAGPTITEVTHVFDEARAAAFGVVHQVEAAAEEDVEVEVKKVEEEVIKVVAPRKAVIKVKADEPTAPASK
jgi:hypothetical protein